MKVIGTSVLCWIGKRVSFVYEKVVEGSFIKFVMGIYIYIYIYRRKLAFAPFAHKIQHSVPFSKLIREISLF